jgi:quercetin dioxygenase-like cupin family protein
MRAAKPLPSAPAAFDLVASIAPELRPLPIPPQRGAQLRCGLIERVRRSALAHRDFSTVRREDGVWTVASPGVRQQVLSAVGGMRVELLQVAPHAAVRWPQDAHARELLVVDGTLLVDAEGAPSTTLSALQQVVVAQAAACRQTAGSSGATLYVRSRTAGLAQLPAAEAQWWAAAQGAPPAASVLACHWARHVDGVDAAVLRAHGEVASMLVKIAPGATAPDHGHSLDEDCFMLAGELFLGDILLRAGDYQLAPVGCRHVGIASDKGGMFYFHGAVPPAASGPAA